RTRDTRARDRRMLLQHVLDLRRRNIDPATFDHLGVATDELDIALGGDEAEVAGTKKPVCREGMLVLASARAYVHGRQVPANLNIADTARRQRMPVLWAHDSDRDAWQRWPMLALAPLERPMMPGDCTVAIRFGLTIHIADFA